MVGDGSTDTRLRPQEPGVVGDRAHWPDLLSTEDDRCRDQGFRAGVISVNLGTSVGEAVIDTRDTVDVVRRASAIVETAMRWTDRACRVGDLEIGILAIPLRDYAELRSIAEHLHRALRAGGVHARIGYAVRNDHSGLLGAAARADAAAAPPLRR